MAQFGELFNRILGSGGTRGLSRDVEPVLPADPRAAFFNDALRRHRAAGDLVADPGLIWHGDGKPRSGLQGHLLAEARDGMVGASDVLLIINGDDWRRSFREVRVPWVERASSVLRQRVDDLFRVHGLSRVFPERPLGFRIIEDGGPEMNGASLRLPPGVVVSGLLPNLHVDRGAGARPAVTVHLHLPGEWEGYREVGALHAEQLVFTLGGHWLDNFQHPGLDVPALYRLHHDGNGDFIHVINPEVKGRYRVTEQVRGTGPAVLRLEHADGEPVAWMLLQLSEDESPQAMVPPRRWATTMSELDAAELAAQGPTPEPGLAAGRSLVPRAMDGRLVTLHETGALLQKVHFARFMEGYDVYIDRGGHVSTDSVDPAAVLHVRGREVSLEARDGGVGLNGQALPPGRTVFISGDARITVGEVSIEWRDLSGIRAPGWPYLGELGRIGSTSHVVSGQRHRIGRDAGCAVRLPDEPHNGNIVWRPELRSGGTIRSRNGDIPKSRFYIDSIMVASEHAELDLMDTPVLRSLARDCYSYVRRGGEIHPLHPQRRKGGVLEQGIQDGDEILIGNCVFRVSWQDATPEAPSEPVTSEELAAVLDVTVPAEPRRSFASSTPAPAPVVVEEEPDGWTADSPEPSDPFGLPPAAGLGERGIAPPPLQFGQGADVLLRGSGDTIDAIDVPTTPASRRDELGLPPVAGVPGAARDVVDGPTKPAASPDALLDAPTRPGVTDPGPLDAPSRGANESAVPGTPVPPTGGGLADSRPAGGDPTALPGERLPPPVAIPTSGDSLLGDFEDPLPTDSVAWVASQDPAADDPAGVVIIDEGSWQHELSRPARLAVRGWMVSGTVVVGNHGEADVVVPENRADPDQTFRPSDYLELYVRGRRGQFRTLSQDARVSMAGAVVAEGDGVDGLTLTVVRRDADGAPDFDVTLELVDDVGLPDPRARLLRLDRRERMASALFTLGLPVRQARVVQLGSISARATYDGERLLLEGYLHTYRQPDGRWRPFFVRTGGSVFRTAPEDGSPIVLNRGDEVISGRSVYVFEG